MKMVLLDMENTINAEYEPILWFSKNKKYIYHPIRVPTKVLMIKT